MRDPKINKGTAFSLRERQLLGIHGLLPPGIQTQEEQAMKIMINLRKVDTDLGKYLFLTALQDRNESLFYRVITDNIEYCLPLIYTPTVGQACQKYGLVYRRPRGLYITIHDSDHIDSILSNWPESNIKAIVVTDGERILGLGDLGASGMGIPVGKLALYTALGCVPSSCTLPILLDVGTDNEELLEDPFYLGLRHKRIRGDEYDKFLDNFMEAIVKRYGCNTLIQFEDFGNLNAYRILEKYRYQYCTFNDDIQGTASVALSALFSACRIAKRNLRENVFLFQGAGSAATGIASLLKNALIREGDSEQTALEKIFMFDVDGLLTSDRDPAKLSTHNAQFAKQMPHMHNLEQVVDAARPTAIIGAAGVPGVFSPTILRKMTQFSERPFIFALSNPTSKAECSALDAYTHTDGRCVFAGGSPFGPVTINGNTFLPGQCNNAYIFPGIALAIILFQIRPVPFEIFMIAAKTLSEQVDEEDLVQGRVFPQLSEIRDVSIAVATEIGKFAYHANIAHFYPRPDNIREFIMQSRFEPQYASALPELYRYPTANSDSN